jgi:phosphatidylethanolamine-binding protein (PEBP) family uncharacterized protein
MAINRFFSAFILFVCLLIVSCQKETSSTSSTTTSTVNSSLVASSSAFVNNGKFPKKYTCDSLGVSPPLSWTGAPSGTNSYAITMHHMASASDKHVYMLIYNIPSTVTSISESVSGVGLFGMNTVNSNTSYSPPCSQGPGDKAYIFTVYALSSAPVFTVPQSQVTMDILLSAISSKTLGTSIINVTYSR